MPLTDLTGPKDAVSLEAETDLGALLQAKTMLGHETPFDLSEGDRLVVAYRPTRLFSPMRLEPESDS